MSASSPRILVTCHANADFDSFAAMLAAHFLYPGSLLLFPGTQERGLQKVVASLDASPGTRSRISCWWIRASGSVSGMCRPCWTGKG